MRTRAFCLLIAGSAIAALGGGSSGFAQSALPFVPQVRSAYQERAAVIASGRAGEVFLGTASVAPSYGFPWMISLQIRSVPRALGHFCGGVAIAPSWVLTAAHCVVAAQAAGSGASRALEPSKIDVLSGSNTLSYGGKIQKVDRIVINPGFRIVGDDKVPENDLALLHVTGTPALVPLERPPKAALGELLKDGAKVRIFGWGTSSFQAAGPISNTLLYAFVDVVGRAKCNGPTIYKGLVQKTMFCAGLGFADACQGDSGGPAIGYINGRKYLVGIISWGVGCTNKKYPGVYVNVAAYDGWIDATVGKAN
jgi:secreted trypsin-like serine protease